MFRENVEAAFKEGPTWRLADFLTQRAMGRMGIPYRSDAPVRLPEPRTNTERGISTLGTMAGYALDPLLYAGGRVAEPGLRALVDSGARASGLAGLLGEGRGRGGVYEPFLNMGNGELTSGTSWALEGVPYQRTGVAMEGVAGQHPPIRPVRYPDLSRAKGIIRQAEHEMTKHR